MCGAGGHEDRPPCEPKPLPRPCRARRPPPPSRAKLQQRAQDATSRACRPPGDGLQPERGRPPSSPPLARGGAQRAASPLRDMTSGWVVPSQPANGGIEGQCCSWPSRSKRLRPRASADLRATCSESAACPRSCRSDDQRPTAGRDPQPPFVSDPKPQGQPPRSGHSSRERDQGEQFIKTIADWNLINGRGLRAV